MEPRRHEIPLISDWLIQLQFEHVSHDLFECDIPFLLLNNFLDNRSPFRKLFAVFLSNLLDVVFSFQVVGCYRDHHKWHDVERLELILLAQDYESKYRCQIKCRGRRPEILMPYSSQKAFPQLLLFLGLKIFELGFHFDVEFNLKHFFDVG